MFTRLGVPFTDSAYMQFRDTPIQRQVNAGPVPDAYVGEPSRDARISDARARLMYLEKNVQGGFSSFAAGADAGAALSPVLSRLVSPDAIGWDRITPGQRSIGIRPPFQDWPQGSRHEVQPVPAQHADNPADFFQARLRHQSTPQFLARPMFVVDSVQYLPGQQPALAPEQSARWARFG